MDRTYRKSSSSHKWTSAVHPTQGQHLWPVRSQLVGLTFTSATLLVAQFGLYYKHDSNSTGQPTHTRKTMFFSCTTIMMVNL